MKDSWVDSEGKRPNAPYGVGEDGAPAMYHDVDVFGHEEGHQVRKYRHCLT